MRNAIGITVGTVVVGMALALVPNTVPPDATEISERITSDWDGHRTCRVVEHGPTGPEPTVNVGWTLRVCEDGTRHVAEWDIATGDVFASYWVRP